MIHWKLPVDDLVKKEYLIVKLYSTIFEDFSPVEGKNACHPIWHVAP